MKRDSGITLVEMLVAMLISSILFLTLGFIIVNANRRWVSAWTRVQAEDDLRYARTRIEYLLRNATSAPYEAIGASLTQYGAPVGYGSGIGFNSGDSIKPVNGKLVYVRSSGTQEVLLDHLSNAVFYTNVKGDPGSNQNVYEHCIAQLELVTERTAPTGEVVVSSCAFLVKNKNSGL